MRPAANLRFLRLSILLTGSALALGACAPDLGPASKLKTSADFAATRTFAAAGPTTAAASADWWTSYNDPQLTALIDEALKGSPTLAAAQARVDQAQAQINSTRAEESPSANFNGSVGGTRQSLNMGFPDQFKAFLPNGWFSTGRLAADINYQLDFWGRNRAALAAATSATEAARADQAAARLMLSTGVAGAYADLRRLYANRAAAQDAVTVRTKSADLFGQRMQAGLENRGPSSQAQAEAAAARADVASIDGQIMVVRHQLAALLGEGPDRGLDIAEPKAAMIKAVALPSTVAADLIGRRPDVAAARARVEAAAQREKVARASYYPNINLAATLGFQSLPIKFLLDSDSQIGSVGPAISLPLFDGGRRDADYRGARGRYEEAVANYDDALNQAFRQAADAVSNIRALQTQLTEANAAVKASQDAYDIANARYTGGLTRYLDVLTAQSTLLNAQRRVADLQAQAFNLDVALVRALGGGYAPSAA